MYVFIYGNKLPFGSQRNTCSYNIYFRSKDICIECYKEIHNIHMYPDPPVVPRLPPPVAYEPPAYNSRRPIEENPNDACGCICINNALFLAFRSFAFTAS